MELPRLQLTKSRERRLKGGHLWVYSNEVDTNKTPLKQFSPGQQVQLISSRGEFLGNGYVNPHSLICARLFSRTDQKLDSELLTKRIAKALQLRSSLFSAPYYRLVYGESDLLPGLVVDRFGNHLSVQLNSAGMELVKEEVIEVLQKILSPESILLRNDSSIRPLEGLKCHIEPVLGQPPQEVELVENGVKMLAPLLSGQKTGWFYDQRINRHKVSTLARDKKVLDVFSYVGSFAIQAGVAGAAEIWAIDASTVAVEMAQKNAEIHGIENRFNGIIGDAFEVLKGLKEEGERFDIVVVDPPAFIKRKKHHREGLRAYHRINELAMRLLDDNGLLLSASCSMHLRREELMEVMKGSAYRTNRHAQVLFEGMQGPDHPVHPAITETRYLKALLARVFSQDKN